MVIMADTIRGEGMVTASTSGPLTGITTTMMTIKTGTTRMITRTITMTTTITMMTTTTMITTGQDSIPVTTEATVILTMVATEVMGMEVTEDMDTASLVDMAMVTEGTGTSLAVTADMGTSMVVMADTGTSLAGTDMDMALGSDMDARTDLVTDFPTVSQFTPNLLSQQQHLSPQPQLNPRILTHPPTLLLLLTVVSRPW